MFSDYEFKAPEPNVAYVQSSRMYGDECQADLLIVPLPQFNDHEIRRLRAEREKLERENATLRITSNEAQAVSSFTQYSLCHARAEIFHLRKEQRLLQKSLAKSRLELYRLKRARFNTASKSYWELKKIARYMKRQKIAKMVRNALKTLSKEFKPVEVSFMFTR